MDQLPTPLTPKDCDLRDFHGTLIDRHRLRASRFNSRANNDEWRAGVNLWLSASDEVPAGSLPDDDIDLCRSADLHRDIQAWLTVKAVAMHGWVKCSDGRWYHPVVCEKALEAWIEKLTKRRLSAAGNAKRYKLEFDSSEIDAAYRLSCEKLLSLNPNSKAFGKIGRVFPAGKSEHNKNAPNGSEQQSTDHPSGSNGDNATSPCGTVFHDENPPDGIPQGSLEKGPLEGTLEERKKEGISGKVEADFFPGDDRAEGGDPREPVAKQPVARGRRSEMARDLADVWNEIVGAELGKVQKITAPRIDRIHKILRDEFNDDRAEWRGFVERIGRSDFLTGRGALGWKADFDWCLKPANFVKIVEGKYDNARVVTAGRAATSDMVVY